MQSGKAADDAVCGRANSNLTCRRCAARNLVAERTARSINHLRALLLERGIVLPQGGRKLEELVVFAEEERGTEPAHSSPVQ